MQFVQREGLMQVTCTSRRQMNCNVQHIQRVGKLQKAPSRIVDDACVFNCYVFQLPAWLLYPVLHLINVGVCMVLWLSYQDF